MRRRNVPHGPGHPLHETWLATTRPSATSGRRAARPSHPCRPAPGATAAGDGARAGAAGDEQADA